MSGIYTWVRNIACYLCVFNVILHIVPNEGFKRYVRFIGGILLVILVMAPLANLTNMSESFDQALRIEGLKEELDNVKTAKEGLEGLKSDKIEQAFSTEIKSQVEQIVIQHEYYPVSTSLEYQKDGESIVGIESADLVISKKNTKIDIHVGQAAKGDGKENEAVKSIKKEIEEVYQIPVGHINIDVRE